jgi:hypothetical protein
MIGSIVLAVLTAAVAFAFGFHTRVARYRQRPRAATFAAFFYPGTIAFGVVILFDHPVTDPAWLQYPLLLAVPYTAGFGLHALLHRRDADDD